MRAFELWKSFYNPTFPQRTDSRTHPQDRKLLANPILVRGAKRKTRYCISTPCNKDRFPKANYYLKSISTNFKVLSIEPECWQYIKLSDVKYPYS